MSEIQYDTWIEIEWKLEKVRAGCEIIFDWDCNSLETQGHNPPEDLIN